MESYLEELGLLHCIEKTLEEEDFFPVDEEDSAAVKKEKEDQRTKRKQEDAKCKSILIHKIADSQLEYIRGKSSPRAIWTTLQHTFERKGVSGVFYLLKQLAGMKHDERRTMEEHILAFEKTIRELESAEIKFDKPVVVFFLLQSMPKSYDQLITVLETLPVEQCSMEFVKSRLLSEDAKRQHNGDRPDTSTAFAGRSGKFVFKCHACGKPGHKRVNCPENVKNERPASKPEKHKKKSKAHVAESGGDVAFMTVDGDPPGGKFRWILDSGASEHIRGWETRLSVPGTLSAHFRHTCVHPSETSEINDYRLWHPCLACQIISCSCFHLVLGKKKNEQNQEQNRFSDANAVEMHSIWLYLAYVCAVQALSEV